MARTRSENFEGIQQGILRKAAQLFAERGYMRCTIGDLVEACGISRGALYHYFDSKHEILFAILHAHVRELVEQVESAAAEGGAPVDVLRRVVRVAVEFNARSPYEQRVLLNDLASLSPEEAEAIKALERRLVDKMADLLIESDRHRRIVERTKKVYAMSLFGIINYTYIWYNPCGPVSPAEFANIAFDTFFNGFGAPPSGSVS